MINSAAIKGEISKRGMSLKDFAEKTEIPVRRLYRNLYKARMGHDDMQKIQKELKFENPWEIFFN